MEMEKTMGVPKPEGSGTEQYLEEMQRIFAEREETYQKRKQEYEQKSQELQKIQTELGRQYQSLEGQKQELASANRSWQNRKWHTGKNRKSCSVKNRTLNRLRSSMKDSNRNC